MLRFFKVVRPFNLHFVSRIRKRKKAFSEPLHSRRTSKWQEKKSRLVGDIVRIEEAIREAFPWERMKILRFELENTDDPGVRQWLVEKIEEEGKSGEETRAVA